jgi:hypothetical protein
MGDYEQMTLWTMQPVQIWNMIQETGVYRCNPAKSSMLELEFTSKYNWHENWQGAFDLTPMDNDWMTRGRWIQATVWELRKEMIRDVRFFVTGKYKRR